LKKKKKEMKGKKKKSNSEQKEFDCYDTYEEHSNNRVNIGLG